MQAENKIHFGVPVFEAILPNFDQKRIEIRDFLLRCQEKNRNNMIRSNHRGWHSKDDLHQSEVESLKWLTTQIYKIGSQFIHHADKARADQPIYLSSMWGNINNYGDWNLPHNHFPCEWSGCVYIDVSKQEKVAINGVAPGDILFMDPLPLGEHYLRKPTVGHTPVNGKIFIFPGYLLHMVAPHYEQDPRISIAFNFRLGER